MNAYPSSESPTNSSGSIAVSNPESTNPESMSVPIVSVNRESRIDRMDEVAVEEPLAVQVSSGPIGHRKRNTLSVTMRTPGHDVELAVGSLFAEGIISEPSQILRIESGISEQVLRVELHPDVRIDWDRLERRGYTTSSCGVCGKTSIDAVESVCDGPLHTSRTVPATVMHQLPSRLRDAQQTFSRTGGLHAAALFDYAGQLIGVREDVGRHNAVDKLIGMAFQQNQFPLQDRILFVSGRVSFELIQKAAMAGVPIFAAVGAPSSLAVELAQRLNMTLLGFVRDERFNIYAAPERITM